MALEEEFDGTPEERASEITEEFRRCLSANQADGEPLNILLSNPVRESLEMYLKRMAGVIVQSDTGIILGEMAVTKAADALPHVTKGMAREALTEYLREHPGTNDRPEIIEGLASNGRP